MNPWQDHILPRLTHLTMRQTRFAPYRARALANANGRVLDIGIGSGLNLPFYGPDVSRVLGLEPSPALIAMADRARRHAAIPIDLVEGTAEAIPIDSGSVDTVVTTWTMCSIANLDGALAEMRRVLKPGGRLLFVEHGRAPQAGVQWWQDNLTPAWRRLSGGCHLNRAISDLVAQAGFKFDHLQTGYMDGPRALTFMYEGQARPG